MHIATVFTLQVATGGHGGIVAQMGAAYGEPQLTYIPAKRHTARSDVNLTRLPRSVEGLKGVAVEVKCAAGWLQPSAMPTVTMVKYGRYMPETPEVLGTTVPSVEVMARVQANLERTQLAGFVGEGSSPYGNIDTEADLALRVATFR